MNTIKSVRTRLSRTENQYHHISGETKTARARKTKNAPTVQPPPAQGWIPASRPFIFRFGRFHEALHHPRLSLPAPATRFVAIMEVCRTVFRLYFTRLILPILFVAGMVAIPFVWLPEVAPPEKPPAAGEKAAGAAAEKTRRATPFQKTMTIGFALILVSVTAGGFMLYRITRSQTASWRRRFAPTKRRGR